MIKIQEFCEGIKDFLIQLMSKGRENSAPGAKVVKL